MKSTSTLLWTLSLLLMILWFAGMSVSSTFGGFLHVLLIPVIVAATVKLGRTTRTGKVIIQ